MKTTLISGAVVGAVLLALLAGCRTTEARPAEFGTGGVRLEYRPGDARPASVFLSGSFNDWKMFDPAFRMLWDGERKVFSVKFSLRPGRYMYKFIVDGEWVSDPKAALRVEDKLGGTMGVFIVRDPNSGDSGGGS